MDAEILDGLLTPDKRYIIVRGRLWRAANPLLPAADRRRSTDALMAARRSLRGKAHMSAEARHEARRAVHRAKIALGERGPVWWDDGAPDLNRRLVRTTDYADWYRRSLEWAATISELLDRRDASSSICPSEVARAGGRQDWRRYLEEVRHVARHMARRGAIVLMQRGQAIDPDHRMRGPIRLARADAGDWLL